MQFKTDNNQNQLWGNTMLLTLEIQQLTSKVSSKELSEIVTTLNEQSISFPLTIAQVYASSRHPSNRHYCNQHSNQTVILAKKQLEYLNVLLRLLMKYEAIDQASSELMTDLMAKIERLLLRFKADKSEYSNSIKTTKSGWRVTTRKFDRSTLSVETGNEMDMVIH